eukprot:jgi/Ulvmu1/1196/UM108_0024.1
MEVLRMDKAGAIESQPASFWQNHEGMDDQRNRLVADVDKGTDLYKGVRRQVVHIALLGDQIPLFVDKGELPGQDLANASEDSADTIMATSPGADNAPANDKHAPPSIDPVQEYGLAATILEKRYAEVYKTIDNAAYAGLLPPAQAHQAANKQDPRSGWGMVPFAMVYVKQELAPQVLKRLGILPKDPTGRKRKQGKQEWASRKSMHAEVWDCPCLCMLLKSRLVDCH